MTRSRKPPVADPIDDRPGTVATPIPRSIARLAPKARRRLGRWSVACCRWCLDPVHQATLGGLWTHDHGVTCVPSRRREGTERLKEDGGSV